MNTNSFISPCTIIKAGQPKVIDAIGSSTSAILRVHFTTKVDQKRSLICDAFITVCFVCYRNFNFGFDLNDDSVVYRLRRNTLKTNIC